jgi:hypothetical protein
MRIITDHLHPGNPPTNAVTVAAVDDPPGQGGANHCYAIWIEDSQANEQLLSIRFQKGQPAECGINGVTTEALLGIVIDRLRGFTHGPFKDRETDLALEKAQACLMWLHQRTADRLEAEKQRYKNMNPAARTSPQR